jgi:ribulose-5-phosphate 4-epimerase/fuculose-1-phosphate aldolase
MGERERLIQNIGSDKNVLILRNHGLLVAAGGVARAYFYYYSLLRACEIQCACGQLPGM